jgi:hypothetical protein
VWDHGDDNRVEATPDRPAIVERETMLAIRGGNE